MPGSIKVPSAGSVIIYPALRFAQYSCRLIERQMVQVYYVHFKSSRDSIEFFPLKFIFVRLGTQSRKFTGDYLANY
jgi:hypothetical protein